MATKRRQNQTTCRKTWTSTRRLGAGVATRSRRPDTPSIWSRVQRSGRRPDLLRPSDSCHVASWQHEANTRGQPEAASKRRHHSGRNFWSKEASKLAALEEVLERHKLSPLYGGSVGALAPSQDGALFYSEPGERDLQDSPGGSSERYDGQHDHDKPEGHQNPSRAAGLGFS